MVEIVNFSKMSPVERTYPHFEDVINVNKFYYKKKISCDLLPIINKLRLDLLFTNHILSPIHNLRLYIFLKYYINTNNIRNSDRKIRIRSSTDNRNNRML